MVSQPAYTEQQNSDRSSAMTDKKRIQHSDRYTTVSARRAVCYRLWTRRGRTHHVQGRSACVPEGCRLGRVVVMSRGRARCDQQSLRRHQLQARGRCNVCARGSGLAPDWGRLVRSGLSGPVLATPCEPRWPSANLRDPTHTVDSP